LITAFVFVTTVLAQVVWPGVQVANAAGFSPTIAFPSLFWTGVFLPALLFLP
jgi:hypothetical protein